MGEKEDTWATLQQAKQRMADILDSHGIELSIFYYGERTEVAVGFRYRGESILEDEHDFTFSNFKEEEETFWPAKIISTFHGVTGTTISAARVAIHRPSDWKLPYLQHIK